MGVTVTPANVTATAIDGLWRIVTKAVTDERGTVREFFRTSGFAAAGLDVPQRWQQINLTWTARGGLRGLHGEVSELSAKGALAPYSEQVRRALDAGLLLHSARLRFTLGERLWEASLDAEFLDVRSAKLPELLTEEEDDRISERLDLADALSKLIDALVKAFLTERTSKAWGKETVPAMKRWMQGEEKVSTLVDRAKRVKAKG